jgi:zinc transport system permease protein
LIDALFEYQFLQNALICSVLASVVCGLIGVIIVEKKLVMLSGGIAHTSYGGVGLGYLAGFEPIIGAFLFSVLAAFGIGAINRRGGTRSDVVIGLFWSLGMALGTLFIALTPGYPPEITSYLFGSILSVTTTDLWLTTVFTAVVLLVIVMLFNHWKAYLFDEEFAAIIGMRTAVLDYLLLVLVALTVVVLIRVAGIILVLALLTAPAAIAGMLFPRLKQRMAAAVAIGCVLCVAGIWISYSLDIASGACIVILSVSCYFACRAARAAYLRRKRKKAGRRAEV